MESIAGAYYTGGENEVDEMERPPGVHGGELEADGDEPEAELTPEEIEAARQEAAHWVQHIWTHTRTLAPRDKRLLYAVLGIDPHTGAMTKATSMPEVARKEKMGARAIEFRLQAVVKENAEVRRALEALDRIGED